MSKIAGLEGQRFGMLVVEAPAVFDPANPKTKYHLICRCDCGNTKAINGYSLLYGLSRSCGCQIPKTLAKHRKKHGHSVGGKRSPTHATWHMMLQRCENPSNRQYPNYGGRGISVCQQWHSFDAFLSDMGERPIGRSLDRIDNDKGYQPDNCRWADRRTQSINRRHIRSYTWNGITDTLPGWSDRTGIPLRALRRRLKDGWDLSLALSTPVVPGQKVRRRVH